MLGTNFLEKANRLFVHSFMSLIRLERKDQGVVVLWMSNGEENRLTVALLNELMERWNEASAEGATCVVLASSSKKFFCNGVDLSETSKSPQLVLEKLVGVCRMIVTSPTPSVAFLNGHGVGGGAFFFFCFQLYFLIAKRVASCFGL
jgi:enoyl-CoA hydratase/carnithine racemase